MEEWEEVEIETSITGLEATPNELHASFEISGDHLSEVRDNHKMVLVEAGHLPESHLSEIAPERRMAWMVERLNGRTNDSGFSIPLHGASDSEIKIFRGEIDGHSILKLRVNSDFERRIPIPKEIESIHAVLENGVLNLNWD